MDALRTINPNQGFRFSPSIGNLPVPGGVGCRCSGGDPFAVTGFPGLGTFPGVNLLTGPQGADPLTQQMLQTQAVMNQTLLQLMQMMLQLMLNRNGGSSLSSTGGGSVASPVGSSSSGDSAATSSAANTNNTSDAGAPGATDTGKKLAEFARTEATNGDSQGGLCYRDVGRALAKVGIQVSGASAYMAADQLAKNPKVKEVKVAQSELTKLPAGAIVVWDKGNGHEHGHISIATGDGKEASDLMRNQITNYGTSFRVFMPV